jgi:CRISPR/Cas system CMR-associated protein Cmr5 small subunit
MQNLEQIRAAAALKVAEKTTKSDVDRLPALILANGLLAATAFASEGDKRPKMAAVIDGLAKHLSNSILGISPLAGCNSADSMIKALSQDASSEDLQRATAEALAFIGYVKRFAQKDDGDTNR